MRPRQPGSQAPTGQLCTLLLLTRVALPPTEPFKASKQDNKGAAAR
jgi:hypothetical protein